MVHNTVVLLPKIKMCVRVCVRALLILVRFLPHIICMYKILLFCTWSFVQRRFGSQNFMHLNRNVEVPLLKL
jgi:hypothetical protein